jgi:hypothetical protein
MDEPRPPTSPDYSGVLDDLSRTLKEFEVLARKADEASYWVSLGATASTIALCIIAACAVILLLIKIADINNRPVTPSTRTRHGRRLM